VRNLGPKSRAWLAQLGIHDLEALRRNDPFRLYARLLEMGVPASLNLLYALIGAAEDRDWREVQRTERSGILLRLDDMGLAPR
jgi:DNA transformation protein and related proteins